MFQAVSFRASRNAFSRAPFRGAAVLCAVTALMPGVAQAQTIYDAVLGTVPGSQGWTYFATGGTQTAPNPPAQPYTTQDTTGGNAFQGGYTRLTPSALDRVTGYIVRFDVGVGQESHTRPDRAGFSTIVIGSDKRGIELGFWGDRVFAQNDGIAADDGQSGTTIFTHGEEGLTDTSLMTRYDLRVLGNAYTLSAGGFPLLTGNLRDYTAFSGPINPYTTANNLFLGDDTTSASTRWNFRFASVAPVVVPEPSAQILFALGLALCGVMSRCVGGKSAK